MTFNQSSLMDALNERGLTVANGLNLLQSRGIISDNCIGLESVADADCEKAIAYLAIMPARYQK